MNTRNVAIGLTFAKDLVPLFRGIAKSCEYVFKSSSWAINVSRNALASGSEASGSEGKCYPATGPRLAPCGSHFAIGLLFRPFV